MPLDGVSADEWLMFDTVLIVRDLFTGGNRSFSSSTDARGFRAAVYNHYGEATQLLTRVQHQQLSGVTPAGQGVGWSHVWHTACAVF
jgi:hypothetical protein